MKIRIFAAFHTLRYFFVILLTLRVITLPANAQSNNLTISAAGFQRMVYSANLYTQLALRPELGACLQTLLEMQRRNPNADPMALVSLSRQALQLYRTNAPVYIRTNGQPDEILAAYLEALRHIPMRTNFVSANLILLNCFMLNTASYNYFTNDTVLDLINSTEQRLFSSKGQPLKLQTLADDCVIRTEGSAAFAVAMNGLLLPEMGVSLNNTPAEIIGNTNSLLHGNGTMTTLLALSQAGSDGGLTVSSNQLANLFTDEIQTVEGTINTNLATLAGIDQARPDYLAYLTNQAAIDADVQLVTAVQQGQPAKLASATAAVLMQSKLMSIGSGNDERNQTIQGVGEMAAGVAALVARNPSGIGSVLSGALGIFDLFGGGSSNDEKIQNEIQNVQTSINDLSQNQNYRFDRVDQSLTTIFDTMNQQFSQIEITLNGQGQQIAQLNGSVYDIRNSLVTVQSSLDRIEAENFASFSAAQQDQIVGPIDNDLLYRAQYPATRGPFPEVGFGGSGGGYEADEGLFYKYALNDANNAISSPSSSLNLSTASLQQQLAARPLVANLNYIQQYLTSTMGVNTVGTPGNPFYLSNPQEWFIATYAYLQLAAENPMYFRKDASPGRVSDIISRGQNIANFCSRLTLIPGTTNINWTLWNALKNNYVVGLNAFNSQVSATETAYANSSKFNAGVWRQWDLAGPRVTTASTAVLVGPSIFGSGLDAGPAPASLTNAVAIVAGSANALALKADGTVIGWGDNSSGELNIPAGLTNAVAVALDAIVSMALKVDGTVIGWGNGVIIPVGLTNVVAISAGNGLGLALKADGTVVAWADGGGSLYGGVPNIPVGLTNVVAIAACGGALALKADGTVVAWGDNRYGQTNIPAGLSNVVAIAAGGLAVGGYTEFDLALKADGTVVAWGDNKTGALNIPAGLSNVVAISAGSFFGVALKADGTVVAWPDIYMDYMHGSYIFPAGLSNVVAISAGGVQGIALLATNTGAGGNLSFTRAQLPRRLGLLFQNDNQNIINELNLTGSPLDNAAGTLAGAKLLLADVLELGMPYTLANDGILHGFIYGNNSIVDSSSAINFLQTQNAQLQASLNTAPQSLADAGSLSYIGFQNRLNLCLTNLQATGQAETPRLVGQTLRLLNLLSDAWTVPTNSPPPVLGISSQTNTPSLVLYGEPFMNYTLQYRDSLGASGWTTTTLTNLQDEQNIVPPLAGSPQRFYRLLLPTP